MTKFSIGVKIRTYLKLGILNLLRIALYRLKLKTGWWQYFCPIEDLQTELKPFFRTPNLPPKNNIQLEAIEHKTLLRLADDLLKGYAILFSRKRVAVGAPPHWHNNPFTKTSIENLQQHWSKIPDFSEKFGDIKTVWELSRAEWAPLLAQAYKVTGNKKYLNSLNEWLEDWCTHNPLNEGPNWKCGQEVSFRVLHILLASLILDPKIQEKTSQTLILFAENHSRRIAATLPYAIAQDNNHGTSEAAALFICGHWLLHFSGDDRNKCKTYKKWAQTGRRNLENRIDRLILDDGTFSQYSPTYQRVVLATLTLVLIWQDILDISPLSKKFIHKSNLALVWLAQLTDPNHGDVPNLGANDGANVFRLSWHEPYRDFRPVINSLSMRLGHKSPYNAPDCAALWFGRIIAKPQDTSLQPFSSCSMPFGGFEKLIAQNQKSWILLRTANFKFRPSHADLNHLDLWVGSKNILMDSGSYSYAISPPDHPHALKTAFSHNTITFDDHDQMPSLGRFLYGAWPKGTVHHGTEQGEDWVQSDILFPDGNYHSRRVLAGKSWQVTDHIKGSFKKAVLRWHLPDLDWQPDGDGGYFYDGTTVKVTVSKQQTIQANLKQGLVSYYYLETVSCKVLEVILEPSNTSRLDGYNTLSVTTRVTL